MVFEKHGGKPFPRTNFLADHYPDARNVRRWPEDAPRNFSTTPEDILLLHRAEEQCRALQSALRERDSKIHGLTERVTKLNQCAASRRARIEDLNERVATLKAKLKGVYTSRSWRVTAPFRAVSVRLNRLLCSNQGE
jgi:hypothetical protein